MFLLFFGVVGGSTNATGLTLISRPETMAVSKCVHCNGAICLIALFVASSDQESNQESGASKQLRRRSPTRICLPL